MSVEILRERLSAGVLRRLPRYENVIFLYVQHFYRTFRFSRRTYHAATPNLHRLLYKY